MTKPFSVTKDVSADLKKLKMLERAGLVKVKQVRIENVSRKIKDQPLPNGVWNHTNWDEMKWASASDAQRFEQIKQIIGKENIKDAIHVDTHIRDGNDYFVTEDNDILSVRGQLEQQFSGLKIRTPDELVSELSNI